MILAVEIENTDIVIGGLQDRNIVFTARIATEKKHTEFQYAAEILQVLKLFGPCGSDPDGAIVASVVPELTEVLRAALKRVTGKKAMVVGTGLKTGLNIKLDSPASLGADRVADTVAAAAQYPLPVLVVDFGTAITMSLTTGKGELVGGAIMPGLRLSLDALSANASLLPQIDLTAPKHAIGRNTVDAMKSGMIYGTAAMVDGMIAKLEDECGEELTVVATGGSAEQILPHCRRKMIYDSDLLLKGLGILYRKNKK